MFQQMDFRCRLTDCVKNADSTENPPPPPPPSNLDLGTLSLTFIGSVIAATTLLGVVYLVLARFFSRRSDLSHRSIGNPRIDPPPISFDTHEEFFDEEQGPHLDHPIWYIHTVGLDQSAIDSIAVFKFKKGEGLIDGTDCSVCLTEFEDDEALRLLPKCSHAFHVACIDMWLRSHKNCPLCRAPVVRSAPASADEADTAANSIPAGNSSDDLARVSEIEEGESSGGVAIAVQSEEAVVKGLRRSVSMDAASASEIYRAVGVAINGGGRRERMKKGKNLSFSSSSRSRRIIGTSFRLYRNIKSCSFGHERTRRNMLLPY